MPCRGVLREPWSIHLWGGVMWVMEKFLGRAAVMGDFSASRREGLVFMSAAVSWLPEKGPLSRAG